MQYLTDDRGERTAVVLPLPEYEKLLEDLADLAVVAERREEPTVPHEQFVSELKRDGIVRDPLAHVDQEGICAVSPVKTFPVLSQRSQILPPSHCHTAPRN